jgi:hypothetical protein
MDNLVDTKTASSQELIDTPFNRAFGTRLQMWDWYELPENAKRHRRFGAAMRGTTRIFPPELTIHGSYYSISSHPQETTPILALP